MSNPDPQNILFSTRYKYFLNKDVEDGSVTLSSTALGPGEATSFSLAIPIENDQDYSQIKMNFSHDSSDWYIFPSKDITLDANCIISVVGSYDGTNLNMTFYVVNQTGGSVNSTATTATVRVYLFEEPQ